MNGVTPAYNATIESIAEDVLVWLKLTQTPDMMQVRPPLEIGNGVKISVQYSSMHNCSGRRSDIWFDDSFIDDPTIPLLTLDSSCEIWYPDDEHPTDNESIRSLAKWIYDHTPRLPDQTR